MIPCSLLFCATLRASQLDEKNEHIQCAYPTHQHYSSVIVKAQFICSRKHGYTVADCSFGRGRKVLSRRSSEKAPCLWIQRAESQFSGRRERPLYMYGHGVNFTFSKEKRLGTHQCFFYGACMDRGDKTPEKQRIDGHELVNLDIAAVCPKHQGEGLWDYLVTTFWGKGTLF